MSGGARSVATQGGACVDATGRADADATERVPPDSDATERVPPGEAALGGSRSVATAADGDGTPSLPVLE